MIEPYSPRPDAATAIFNLPDYRVTDTEIPAFGQRRIRGVATAEVGCPSCGVISNRVRSRRPQRLRDIPVAGPIEVVWAMRRFFCDEYLCPRQTFTEETTQVPRRARSTRRLRDALVSAVIGSGRGRGRGRAFVRCLVVAGPAGLGFRGADAARCRRPGTADARHR
ncbi:transposase family protein [Pseudarthrobacter sp. L1SW]|uniref:transposase family protein n=1 Tax=Pseudarthrobacter sp. L1SW TaxID=2851598 RepID=UPI001E486D27|nr:transposase family protein [Pseudarthrobacter sp. L1SW]